MTIEDLERIERDAIDRAQGVASQQDLAQLRAEVVGKKGVLGQALRQVRELPAEQRPQAGQQINAVKARIEAALHDAQQRLEAQRRARELEAGRFDVTLPGRRVLPGAPHPLRLVEQEIIDALVGLGFSVAEGPEVEHDWYNFEALNIPADHPARDMQDTFFVAPHVVLRTHTSNVQIRTMRQKPPPVRILAPGMVFRNDAVDATHSPVFHQVEGLWVDDKATFADLKGVLHRLMAQLFGPDVRMRYRPSYFPFTEPSLEVDVSRPETPERWLEVLGAGMVHPEVLNAVGYDPDKLQGFAFGVGVERIALLRWGIDDIRLFYENDLRFLEQFSTGRR